MTDTIIKLIAYLFAVLATVAAVAMVIFIQDYQCKVKTQGIGEGKYVIIGGFCMVKPEGQDKFIPLENYRKVD